MSVVAMRGCPSHVSWVMKSCTGLKLRSEEVVFKHFKHLIFVSDVFYMSFPSSPVSFLTTPHQFFIAV